MPGFLPASPGLSGPRGVGARGGGIGRTTATRMGKRRGAWDRSRIRGGDVIAREVSAGGRPYGVSSVHACDDGSRVAVSVLLYGY